MLRVRGVKNVHEFIFSYKVGELNRDTFIHYYSYRWDDSKILLSSITRSRKPNLFIVSS